MKHPFFLILLVFLNASCRILDQPQQLSGKETKNITTYCKVWGFLKYYHHAVADGNINWDSAFIKIYPKAKAANSNEDLSSVLLELYGMAEHVRNDSGHFTYAQHSDEEVAIIDFHWLEDHSIF